MHQAPQANLQGVDEETIHQKAEAPKVEVQMVGRKEEEDNLIPFGI